MGNPSEHLFAEVAGTKSENKVLSNFKEVVLWLHEECEKREYGVTYDTGGNSPVAITRHFTDQPGGEVILPSSTTGLNLLWDFIHEFGHVLLGQPNTQQKEKHCWERKAWQEGWAVTSQRWVKLRRYQDSYQDRQEKCLLSYVDCCQSE